MGEAFVVYGFVQFAQEEVGITGFGFLVADLAGF